jgi:hypothetical protein
MYLVLIVFFFFFFFFKFDVNMFGLPFQYILSLLNHKFSIP